MPDMHITVGHIIDNPTFDCTAHYMIVTSTVDDTYETLYDSNDEESFGDRPRCELLICNIEYITVRDGVLILEVNW